jgi:hypothetical protein
MRIHDGCVIEDESGAELSLGKATTAPFIGA